MFDNKVVQFNEFGGHELRFLVPVELMVGVAVDRVLV